jgi:hypothetical protein
MAALAFASAIVAVGGIGLPAAKGTTFAIVDLGRHRFGHLTPPDGIVARVGADGVGFEQPGEGPDESPWSFDVAPDGSIWLLDQFDDRLLEWEPGHPDEPSRTVPLPKDEIGIAADLAVGAGAIYLSYVPAHPSTGETTLRVCALDRSGRLLWTTETGITIFNSRLRIVPDGSVYWEGTVEEGDRATPGTWTPVTSSSGTPLSPSQQRARGSPYQPMPGDLRFEATETGEVGNGHEWRFELSDADGAVRNAWRIVSDDDLGGTVDEPGSSNGHTVVTVEVARQTPDDYLYEYVVLTLSPGGEGGPEVSLDPHAVYGDVPVTGTRVGPDGALYQLRTDIRTGVRITRFSLGATTSSPSSTPSTDVPMARATAATPSTEHPAHPTPAASTRRAIGAPADTSSRPWLLPALLVAVCALGLSAWLLWWRRAGRRMPPPPRS